MTKKDKIIYVVCIVAVVVFSLIFGAILGTYASAYAETTGYYTLGFQSTYTDTTYTYSSSSLSFVSTGGHYPVTSSSLDTLLHKNGYQANTTTLTVNLLDNVYSTSDIYFNMSGSSISYYTVSLIDSNNVTYQTSLSLSTTGMYKVLATLSSDVVIKKIVLVATNSVTSLDSQTVDISFSIVVNQFDDGYSQGYIDGIRYADSRINNSSASWSAGYDAGQTQNGFLNLFTATLDAPVQVLTSLFDFDFLGINLKGFFLSLLTIAVIIMIVRLCMGAK